MSGPVSEAMEREIFDEVRRKGIVVWLDKDAAFTQFVDALEVKQDALRAKCLPFIPVVPFRGSFLDLLIKLEPYGDGLDPQPLLVHMPGFNEETVRTTPVLELYQSGKRFEKALGTLVREAATSRAVPSEVETFLSKKPTLEDADAWLSRAVSQNNFGLSAVLDEVGPLLLVQALGGDHFALEPRVQKDEEVTVLRGYVHKLTGMDEEWRGFGSDPQLKPLANVLGSLAAWLLCVEYVHDLRRLPHLPSLVRLKALSPALVKSCSDILNQVRDKHWSAYERLAMEVESFLTAELAQMTAEDLGSIDTFRAEGIRTLDGSVEALLRGDWKKAKEWCDARQGARSFWLARDQNRKWAWALVDEAATFGETIERHQRPFANLKSFEDAAQRYAEGAFEVDRAQRRFEQKRLVHLEPRLPHFGLLQEVAGSLRRLYRAWADTLCKDFATLCKDQGFLPPSSLMQRTLFEEVVHPLTLGGEKVAVFVIDAFRFEMATELVEELRGSGSVVSLKPRFAELPTITSVGMNVLPPVSRGDRLSVAGTFGGFKTGEYTVKTPDDRARAMGGRSVGKKALSLKLEEVCEANTAALMKQVKPHALVVVHSKEIDDAGEANVGLRTFESSIGQIKAAWRHLELAGVKQFVFTADHGFLLQDETTACITYKPSPTVPRRHVLAEHARAETGMVNVAVSALGYEGVSGYLLFREDTAVFATGNPGATFVHGGNSPEERIIPVLTVTRKRAEMASLGEYSARAEWMADALDHHRIRVQVTKQATTLGYAAAQSIDLSLRVPNRPEIRVSLKGVAGGSAKLKAGRLHLPVGGDWAEVFFGLEGPTDERVRVEVHHPDKIEKVESATPDAWFSVTAERVATAPGAKRSEPPPLPVAASDHGAWADAITDEGMRKVFLHIEKHRSITEVEVTHLVGSPRAFRKFSLEYELYLSKLPFGVRTEVGEGGKRYVREGDK